MSADDRVPPEPPLPPELPVEQRPSAETAPLPGQAVDAGRGRIFPCDRCGADLVFQIGQQQLQCPYCAAIKTIDLSPEAEVREQDYEETLARLQARKEAAEAPPEEHQEVRCDGCGANVLFEGTLTSTICPYCGSPIQREKIHRGGFRLAVDAVLPFKVEERRAVQRLRDWATSRWFAPNAFRKTEFGQRFNGVYLPFWTFDSLTFTRYRGQRGDDYRVTVGTGKDRRTVTRTRWSPAQGQFQRFFDDVLINGTGTLPQNHLNALAPWPLQDAQPFTPEFLAGHFSRTYEVELPAAFENGKQRMHDELAADCRRRIGGDRQQLDKMDCRFDAVTYKHLLLPVYMLTYPFAGRTYQVFINGATGYVTGDRPYSWVKITLAILAVLLLVGIIYAFQR